MKNNNCSNLSNHVNNEIILYISYYNLTYIHVKQINAITEYICNFYIQFLFFKRNFDYFNK